jgi:NAD(P)-dependent dehydrogenase (short-subunit alcohol dehydrogenase family)
MGRLSGKIAIINGLSSQVDAAVARLFAKEDARVILTHNGQDSVLELADEIIQAGGEAIALRLDVTSTQSWAQLVKLTVEAYGRIHILVNVTAQPSILKLEQETVASWEQALHRNTTGISRGIKTVAPELRDSGGSIVNVVSTAAITPNLGNAISASEGANRIISKSAAIEYAEAGIRVNSVYIGNIHFGVVTDIPIGRKGTSEDAAYAVLFLASDEASFITGSELVVDGGSSARAKRDIVRG